MLCDNKNVNQNTLDLIKWVCSIMIKYIKRGDIEILYIYLQIEKFQIILAEHKE